MTEEAPEVRELALTKLGGKTVEARLTLTDDKLIIETPEESPLPEWLRGEMAFDELDIAYIDPTKEQKKPETEEGEDEEEAEPQVLPGFRLARWIELKNEETGAVFDRRGVFVCDDGHVDLAQAEAFALTFLRLAGRPLPGEKEEAAAEEPAAEEIPTGAPEAAEPAPAPAEEKDETPAFAPSGAFAPADEDDDPKDKAFV